MIDFENGHRLLFCNGSGALGFNGKGWWWEQPFRWLGLLNPKAFTVVAKTVTFEPKKGNLSLWHPWTCVRLLYRSDLGFGAVNAVGLTNPGYKVWIERDYPEAIRQGYKIAASVKPENEDEAEVMGTAMRHLNLAYIEVNVSCPNVMASWAPKEEGILNALRSSSRHPIVLKLSHSQIHDEFIKRVDPYIVAYHAINTIPWDTVFSLDDRKSPISKYKHGLNGGVSGAPIRHWAASAVFQLGLRTKRPIIGGGGIQSLEDVKFFERMGAQAFSIGTQFLTNPTKPNRIMKAYTNALTFKKGDILRCVNKPKGKEWLDVTIGDTYVAAEDSVFDQTIEYVELEENDSQEPYFYCNVSMFELLSRAS